MSWLARLRSKSIEALNSSMTLAGPAANRPPHIVLLMSVNPEAWTDEDRKPTAPAICSFRCFRRNRGDRRWERSVRDSAADRQGRGVIAAAPSAMRS